MAPTVSLTPDLIRLLQGSGKPLDEWARELIVVELYRRSHISSGKAAELLGMDRFAFIQYASSLGIPFFNMTPEELRADLANNEEARRVIVVSNSSSLDRTRLFGQARSFQ